MFLDGKYALITGSSRGIGRGIALKLAASHVKVAVHYYQNEEAAKDTLAEIRKLGSDGFVVQGDVSQPEQIEALFRRVKTEFGALDIFVSNARPLEAHRQTRKRIIKRVSLHSTRVKSSACAS